MRPSLSAALAALAFCIGSMAAQPLFAQEPEGLEPLDEELPQVTIVKRGDDTITEFRLRGKLYMVKVTQPNGMSYYLIDQEGKGHWVRDNSNGKLIVPTWVLTNW
ncbi:MAG: DUF2782 domain-containing protein [Betaproteobacteria bacterium]|nr:DUF2782 domain-containing protein [Betaproteobacteria bacterium]